MRFHKEWLKVRGAFSAFALAAAFSLAYIFIGINAEMTAFGADGFLISTVMFQSFSYKGLTEINVIFAALVGFATHYSEQKNARLRIHMHLPVSFFNGTSIILIFSLALLCAVFAAQDATLFAGLTQIFPPQLVRGVITSLVFNQLEACIVFLGTAGVIIEPNRTRAAANLLLTIGFVAILELVQDGFYANGGFWHYALGFASVQLAIYYLSFYRYTRSYIK